MMCPWSARIGARRSLRPVSNALKDPVRPPGGLHRLHPSAAPALLSAPRTPPRGCRLRSEVTETSSSPPKTALLPVVFFVYRSFPYLIASVPSSMLILILSSSLPTVRHPRVSSIFFIFGCPSRSGGKREPQKTEKRQTGREGVEPREGEERGRAPEPNQTKTGASRRGEAKGRWRSSCGTFRRGPGSCPGNIGARRTRRRRTDRRWRSTARTTTQRRRSTKKKKKKIWSAVGAAAEWSLAGCEGTCATTARTPRRTRPWATRPRTS